MTKTTTHPPAVAPVPHVRETRHGSPFDRGSADAYYGREFNPHYYDGPTYQSTKRTKEDMTADQIQDYSMGYFSEDDRKNWR